MIVVPRILSSVLFPEPFGPRSTTTSPAATWKVTSLSAVTGPNRFETARTEMPRVSKDETEPTYARRPGIPGKALLGLHRALAIALRTGGAQGYLLQRPDDGQLRGLVTVGDGRPVRCGLDAVIRICHLLSLHVRNPILPRVTDPARARGAYGLEVWGLPDVELLVPVTRGLWPRLDVRVGHSHEPASTFSDVGNERASLNLEGGESALLDRRKRSAVFATNEGSDGGELIHPLLTAAGTVFAWWQGHEAFHGGAFMNGDGAWAILGDRGSGKSSLLAALAMAGHGVLSDDLLVVDGERALAGPRCVDLRSDVAKSRFAGRTESVRGGQRERFRLGSVEPEVPIRGWIGLGWGARPGIRSLAAGERLAFLASQRNVQGIAPQQLLHLVHLPAWELSRTKDWDSFDGTVEMVLAVTDAGVGQPGRLQQ